MELYNRKNVVVRKPHNCFLCPVKIQTKTKCLYESGKYDGEFFSRYSHPECMEAFENINEDAYLGEDWILLNSDSSVFDFNKHVKTIKEKYEVK